YRLWDLRIPLDLLGVDGVEERGQGIEECLALGAMRLGGVDVCDEVGAESAQEEFPGKGRTGPILFAGRFGYVARFLGAYLRLRLLRQTGYSLPATDHYILWCRH